MITLEQFTAEIENTFKNYTETGDIDKISIKGWVISCLKEFGVNICDMRETIIQVNNSQSTLPALFKSLKKALKLNPQGYKIDGNLELAKDSYTYRTRIENAVYWDWNAREYVDNCNTKIITERVEMNKQPAEFYYSPQWLSLVKGFKKDTIAVDCENLHPSIRNAYPDQISISGHTIQTNFREGAIYVQYYSLPSDEDGEVVIPEFSTGDIIKYIENYVKIKIGEDLVLNNKNAQGASQLVSMWIQNMRVLRNRALSEANWDGMSSDFSLKLQSKRNIQMSKFNLPRI